MTKTELDVLWSRALREALEAGEEFTRYRFAALVAEKERDALKQIAWTDLMRQGGLVTWNDAYELGQRVMVVLESRGNK